MPVKIRRASTPSSRFLNRRPMSARRAYQYMIPLIILLVAVIFIIMRAESVARISEGFFKFFGK